MTEDGVRTEQRGKILVITMDRPKANAINHAMSRALYRAYDRLQNDPGLMVGILTSENDRIFSGGWDLKELATGVYLPHDYLDPVIGHGPGGFAGICDNWVLDKPVIAAVHGAAVGGGFEMTLSCDVILASDETYFQLPELMRGFLPDAGGFQRLPKLIPPKVATEFILTGRRMSVAEAERWGVVARVMPRADLMPQALDMAETIAKGAPLAIQALKAQFRQIENLSHREAMAKSRPGKSGLPIFERMMQSDDFREGPKAFAEKRAPRWTGN